MARETKTLENQKSQVCLNLTNKVKIAGQKVAEKKDISFSALVDELIEKEVAKRGTL